MTEYIWSAEGEDDYEKPVFFKNEHKAMEYANSFYPGNWFSWYMVKEDWWRGVNAATGDAWSVIRYELHD
jgi:hypothetical protein